MISRTLHHTVLALIVFIWVVPFIALQLGMLIVLALWPGLATWLPSLLYGD